MVLLSLHSQRKVSQVVGSMRKVEESVQRERLCSVLGVFGPHSEPEVAEGAHVFSLLLRYDVTVSKYNFCSNTCNKILSMFGSCCPLFFCSRHPKLTAKVKDRAYRQLSLVIIDIAECSSEAVGSCAD